MGNTIVVNIEKHIILYKFWEFLTVMINDADAHK